MENNKKEKVYKATMLILITAIITFMVTSTGMYNYYKEYYTNTNEGRIEVLKNTEISKETSDINAKLETVKECLEEYYIGELKTDKMTEMAIKGYVEGLDDEYTEYLTKDEYEDLMVNVTGDYVGIGVYIYKNNNGNIVILTPIENSPATAADLQPEDIILTINGEECNDMDINIASSKIKGEEGTTVTLEIKRGEEILNKTIERKNVEIASSRSEILENNIGYIQLATFDEGSADNVSNYLNEFKNKGIKSVIIDLRNNTGGIVTEAIEISEMFVKNGDIIMRLYNKEQNETIIKSQGKKTVNMNVVLLVNEYSASATEIVTAALRDNNVATIVGTKTFGKGVMQEILTMFDGALKVTTEEFKTPNGDIINKAGITPDIEIEDDLETEEDEQLKKAIEIIKK